MARLVIYEGLRPGELLALRWGSLESDAVWIRQRVYQGKLDTPKSGKPRVAALSDGTLADLRMWRKVELSTAANAFVFPSENPASPLDMGNLWGRAFAPRLRSCTWSGQRFRS
jgi:integrase